MKNLFLSFLTLGFLAFGSFSCSSMCKNKCDSEKTCQEKCGDKKDCCKDKKSCATEKTEGAAVEAATPEATQAATATPSKKKK